MLKKEKGHQDHPTNKGHQGQHNAGKAATDAHHKTDAAHADKKHQANEPHAKNNDKW